jgi:serine/threonine-protein kinase HipA
MYPVFGGKGLHPRDAKLAMGLTATKGKKYAIEQIFPRHFYQTAKAVGFEQAQMAQILSEFAESMDRVIKRVRQQLPDDFPTQIADTILNGLKARAIRLE